MTVKIRSMSLKQIAIINNALLVMYLRRGYDKHEITEEENARAQLLCEVGEMIASDLEDGLRYRQEMSMTDITVTLDDDQLSIVVEALKHLHEDADNDDDAEEIQSVARMFGVEIA